MHWSCGGGRDETIFICPISGARISSYLLLMAASSPQGMFVAASTSTPWSSFPTPCICTRNSVTTDLDASFDELSLLSRTQQSGTKGKLAHAIPLRSQKDQEDEQGTSCGWRRSEKRHRDILTCFLPANQFRR